MASTYFDANLPPRNHLLRLNVSEGTKDVVNNRTLISWSLEIYRAASWKPYGSDGAWSVSIDGNGYSGTFSYNFNNYTYLLLASGSTWVYHAADGTAINKYFSGYGSIGSGGGANTAGGYWSLTTIPRATQPSVSPTSGETGTTFTITHTPATSTFYHDVAYSLDGGANYTDIVTNLAGTDTSTDWTPAHSLLPNDASKTAIIRVKTYASSGGTLIGEKTVNLPLTVPTSVKPTISSVAWADDQTSSPDLPTLMGGSGRFVQRWSKLKPTVTSAGAGGSSVTASAITLNGQTTSSGAAFGLPVALSGSVPFTAAVTDSRGRTSDPFNDNVTVKAYNYPNLPTPLVTRTSDAGGTTPSPTGTYLKVTPNASVSDLTFSGSQKNDLEYQIRVKTGAGSYTTVQAWTSASGITWTSNYIISGKSAASEHTVEVSIRDVFGKNGYDTGNTVKTLTVTVPSEAVQLDLDGTSGVGVGKYRQNGMLDVNGDIYMNNNKVVDASQVATDTAKGIVELATNAETLTGTDTSRAVTPAGFEYALEGRRDAGLFDTRYYTETEIDTKLAQGWERVVPGSISSTGATATLNSTTGVVTVPAGTTAVQLNTCLDTSGDYEYWWKLDLAFGSTSLSSADYSPIIRMVETISGVHTPNTTAGYNQAGTYIQYNGVGGNYTVGGGTYFAGGNVSLNLGAPTYVDYSCDIRLVPWQTTTQKAWFMFQESFTGGSARSVRSGGYSPAPTVAFSGLRFAQSTASMVFKGKMQLLRRKRFG